MLGDWPVAHFSPHVVGGRAILRRIGLAKAGMRIEQIRMLPASLHEGLPWRTSGMAITRQ